MATTPITVPVQLWSVDEVAAYISTLQIDDFSYSEHANSFRKEMINGHLLLNLSKTDLNSIGIGQFEKRNALFRHLESLRSTHTGFDFEPSPNNEHTQQT